MIYKDNGSLPSYNLWSPLQSLRILLLWRIYGQVLPKGFFWNLSNPNIYLSLMGLHLFHLQYVILPKLNSLYPSPCLTLLFVLLPLNLWIFFTFNSKKKASNHICSFLKNLTVPPQNDEIAPTPSLNPTCANLFEQFEDLYMAGNKNPEVVNEDENAETAEVCRPPEVPLRDTSTYDEKHQMFTLNNIPPSKWHERFLSITSWLQVDSQFYDIITVIWWFLSRLEGRLTEWYVSLGKYRQL